MELKINPERVTGITPTERAQLAQLLKVYAEHEAKNREKEKYYEGKIGLNEVNLGLALPQGIRGLEVGCAWGAKAVDVLAARSMFDGFVGSQGENVDELDKIVEANGLTAAYMKAVRDELKFGHVNATLSADGKNGSKIRFHSPKTSAALWDGEKGRIGCGFAIIDLAPDDARAVSWSPSIVNFYTDSAIIVLNRNLNNWSAKRYPHKMGRPLMEPLIWNATSEKPFGRSRLKEPIRRLIQAFVRTMANATIALEFSTAPQKYILGVTNSQYEKLVNAKFTQYVGSILAATYNPDSGEMPKFGQLPQGTISPHIEQLRALATQFSAATGLPVTDTGVINDANPSSSDAIEAQTKTLVGMAEELNAGNAEALKNIALMALAIANNKKLEELDEKQRDVVAHFKNPAMPSVAATADAAIKIASGRPSFAHTDIYLEMIGFSMADIRRIKAEEQKARGLSLVEELENE